MCIPCIGVFCWSLGSVPVFCISVCILGLGHSYLPFFFLLLACLCIAMPPKNSRKAHKEDDLEHELEPVSEVAEGHVITSPISSASSYSTVSGSSRSSGTVSSEQLEQILAANNRALVAALSSSGSAGSSHRSQVKIPKWTDEETPYEFFNKLETALTHNGVDKATWGHLLPVYLAGKAQAAFAQVDQASLGDYDAVKAVMLEALGDTTACADRRWWTLGRQSGEEPAQFYLRVRATGLRMLSDFTSRDAVVEQVILSRFLSLLSSEGYSSVVSKHPKSGLEAARFLQEFEETRTFSRRRQHWKSDSNHHSHSGRREPTVNNSSSSGGSSPSSGASSGAGVKEVAGGSPSAGAPASSGSKSGKGRQNRKPIVCHGCGEPGHIRPDCPNKVRRIHSPECEKSEKFILVDGCLAGTPVQGLQVDNGASRSVVSARYIPQSAYLEKFVTLDSWRGKQTSRHQLAKISIQVEDVTVDAVVAVVDQMDCPALLGLDLGAEMGVKLATICLDRAKAAQTVCETNEVTMQDEVVEQICVTRAQAKKLAAEVREYDLASAQSECLPVSLQSVIALPDSYFEQDEACDVTVEPVEENSEWPGMDEVEIPLPTLDGDHVKLSEEQREDSSLKLLWQKGVQGDKGYTFDRGVLVHHTVDGVEEAVRVVVPTKRRLQMGHSSSIAGHFGVKKTHAKISRHFYWPGLWTQVKSYVRTCEGCQLAARQHKSKAPLQPLPCVGEPFQKVAFDLVGPLPRTPSGNKYLLTAMCLYTKFPHAVPLKKVDNVSVLEAMMEIFAVYGMPDELLTDQGSVFTSKLTTLMCKTFGITKIRTSPYHPQSDGALERWHACLKGMIKRAGGKLSEWDKQLKFLLFAYRDTPHCVTGFSPFSLMFGRDVRGPLHFLKTSWLEGELDVCSVGDWLASVKAKMCEMSEIVSDREVKAKASMKSYYDRSASAKSFKDGDMVLVKKPVKPGKMKCAWAGPFEVERCVSPVTYALKLPGRSNKAKVIHCNLLKQWHTPAEKLHRVMVVSDEESESESSPGLRLGRDDFVPSVAEQAMLEAVLEEYRGVLCATPGRTEAAQLSIRTGDSKPVSSHPYRVPPKWKDSVKVQLDQLLELGIIEPSSSPWSSSLVIVKKKDGGVRTCVDYRAVNAVTEPDPYLMPLIEEILDMLASAAFISKIDLTKGFHQIPINPVDCPKTSFCTPWGKFQFRFMPFGLRNGPAVFQRLMDSILHRDKEYSQVYIDDIAVFSTTWEEHCHHIGVVLSRLQEAGLTANVSKCQWAQTQVEFLGHVVGKGIVSPAELKVRAVADFQLPKTKKGVRQFLGLTGYYRRFIPNFAEHSFHLTEATRKTAPERIMYSDVLNDEFLYLKSVLCSVPTLTLPVPADSFVLQTDASGIGLGAVLSVLREEVEHPVAFFSKKLLPRERKYSASELEALAVVVAVGHFEAYLITHPFTVVTDHKALTFLNTAQHRNGRLARWAMKLQPFTFNIRYRPGPQNVNADVLSRLFVDHDSCCDLPPSGMPDAPTSPETFGQAEGGGDVMESSPQ